MRARQIPTLALLLALAACAGVPAEPGQSGGPRTAVALARGTEPMTNGDALVIYCAGLDRLFADPRDAGLRRALGMMDDRLLELPAELGASDFPLPAGTLVFDALAQPMSLTFNVQPDADRSQGLGFDAQLTVRGDAAAVESMAQRFAGLLARMAGVPSRAVPGSPGLRAFDTPAGSATHGVVGDGSESGFVLALGHVETGALGLGSLDLPAGVEPLLAFKLDLEHLQDAIQGFLGMLGPEAGMLGPQLALSGLGGDHPMAITWAFGSADGVGHSAGRVKNYVPIAEANGSLESAPLSARDLALIPADAVSAAIVQSDPSAAIEWLGMASPDPEFNLIEMIDAFTGVHLDHDVFAHLGTTTGYYTADSTGGGGLMSAVLFIEVTDEAGLSGTLDFVFETLDDLAAAELDGRVDFRQWDHGGARCSTLTFPGWPVPIELSLAITDGFLFLTLSPQALAAAIDQRRGARPGLTANADFMALAAGSLDDLTSVGFVDNRRRIAAGYGLATLLGAALANGVRSPENPSRDPGLVIPPWLELTDGCLDALTLGRIEGDDLVTIGRGDPSVTANLVSLCGSPLVPLVMAIGAGVAIALPAVMLRAAADDVAFQEFHVEALSAEQEAQMFEALRGVGDTEEGDD